MMKTLLITIIAVFCYVIFFLSPSDSYASTCAIKETIYSTPQFFLLSDNVFAGTVTSITDYGNHQWQVHFDIEKAWKGAATRQTSTVMTNTLQACGYSISVGEKYLIYTNGSPPVINPIYSKLYFDALGDIALFDDPKFQSQEQAKEDLNKKLKAAQDRVGSMMMDKSPHIPVVTVGVDQVNSTLDIMIDDEKATLSIEQYQQDLKEILGDIPIKVEFGHPTALMPILHSEDDQGQTTSHPIIHGSNSRNVLQSPLQQFRSGVSAQDVKCNENLLLAIKLDYSPACVTESSAERLFLRGWAYGFANYEPVYFIKSNSTAQITVKYYPRNFQDVAPPDISLALNSWIYDTKSVYPVSNGMQATAKPDHVHTNSTTVVNYTVATNNTKGVYWLSILDPCVLIPIAVNLDESQLVMSDLQNPAESKRCPGPEIQFHVMGISNVTLKLVHELN